MKILTVDIGTGTQDIFLYDSRLDLENGFKLVVPSPTMIVNRRIKAATQQGQAVLLRGVMMGGGPSQWAAEDHIRAGLPVYATPRRRVPSTMTWRRCVRWASRWWQTTTLHPLHKSQVECQKSWKQTVVSTQIHLHLSGAQMTVMMMMMMMTLQMKAHRRCASKVQQMTLW